MHSMKPLTLAAPVLLAALAPCSPAAAQTAPDVGDFCQSDRNGLNSPTAFAGQSRSCAAVSIAGRTGLGAPAIGNGRDGSVYNGTGTGSVSWTNQGWTNLAQTAIEGSSGFASSDLTTGQLKASSATRDYTSIPVIPGSGPQVFQLTRMADTIVFSNTSGSSQTLTLSYSYDGQFVNGQGSTSNYGYVSLDLISPSLRNVNGNVLGSAVSDFYASGLRNDTTFSDVWAFTRFGSSASGPFGGTGSTRFVLPTGQSELSFGFALYLQCRTSPTDCLFGNTSALGFAPLPAGVSFTSRSGVFLTGLPQQGAVPEPATWAMMILGFGAIGGAMRGRRTRMHVRFS